MMIMAMAGLRAKTVMRFQIRFLTMFILWSGLSAWAKPVHLRCEYLENPLGIDTLAPRLSWQSDNVERDWKQSAYDILVASSADLLAANKADIWDSGRVDSDDSVGIVYAGPSLESRHRYYWKVRVWDVTGRASESFEAAWWEMGLLHPSDWKAQWIRWQNPDEEVDRAATPWIWISGENAFAVPPGAKVEFRTTIKLREKPSEAEFAITARQSFIARVNGREVGRKARWGAFDQLDITNDLVIGKNSVEVGVIAPAGSDSSPLANKTVMAGFAALIKIRRPDGSFTRLPASGRWQARRKNGEKWRSAQVVADLADQRLGDPGPLPQPAAYLRKSFQIHKELNHARLYVTALGSYRVFLNETRVGDDVLTPGFTDYRRRVLYQAYDVTSRLRSGPNAIGAILGDGWYGSPLTWAGAHIFSPPDRFFAQLELDFSDGSNQTIISDGTWKTAESPVVRSEIYAGELYDARLDQSGWSSPAFDDSRWTSALLADTPAVAVSGRTAPSPQVVATLTPRTVSRSSNGAYVFDMGQNMVGWARLKVRGERGTRVRLRFAEILNPDGTIYTKNLRGADATDTYVLRGGDEEAFTPHFTFHGFRYIEVTGYPGVPALDAIQGEVVSSLNGPPVGDIVTSSDLVNRMWSIGIWGQRGNFLSIPTDCPQRDERLGWMGDAEVFWRTGSYNFDIAAFSQKFMQDIVDAQGHQGAFTNVSPNTLPGPEESEPGDSSDRIGAPGWGDAGVIIPWTTWMQYGDQRIIRVHWEAMQRWMEFIQSRNPDYLREKGVGPNYADWLAPDDRTNKDLLATAYWALLAHMMSQMARAIGKNDDAAGYDNLEQSIRAAFQKAYIKDDGTVGTGTQTSYVVALYTKMAPPELEPKLVEKLVADIESRHWHLSTGFLGTPFLLFTLSDHGRTDVAYRLLLNDTYPSWGYMLAKGATTWWERWNGDTGDPAMNSYNHYAFGSVTAWVYRYAAGIDATTEAPGFKEIVIHPHIDPQMKAARAEYESIYGKVVSDWTATDQGSFSLNVTIPANTSARVILPAIAGAHVTEDGRPLEVPIEDGTLVVHLGSGSYHFEVNH